MSKISEASINTINQIQTKINVVAKHNSMEGAAQTFMSLLYEQFRESIVLSRLFATVPYGKLPAKNKEFVDTLAKSTGITGLINDNTLVLSLLGTHGEKPYWNDRRNSQGHVGIPLASADFIDAIPMMSRLLKELGLNLDWIASGDTAIVAKAIGKSAGVFHVPDAKTTTDSQNRKIIAGQDFVDEYNVKTVFGIGGGYVNPNTNTFLTNIIFCREPVDKRTAELFIFLVNSFKLHTLRFDKSGTIFAP